MAPPAMPTFDPSSRRMRPRNHHANPPTRVTTHARTPVFRVTPPMPRNYRRAFHGLHAHPQEASYVSSAVEEGAWTESWMRYLLSMEAVRENSPPPTPRDELLPQSAAAEWVPQGRAGVVGYEGLYARERLCAREELYARELRRDAEMRESERTDCAIRDLVGDTRMLGLDDVVVKEEEEDDEEEDMIVKEEEDDDDDDDVVVKEEKDDDDDDDDDDDMIVKEEEDGDMVVKEDDDGVFVKKEDEDDALVGNVDDDDWDGKVCWKQAEFESGW